MRARQQTSVLIKPTATTDPATTKALDDLRRAARVRDGLLDGAQRIEDVALVTTGFARIKHGLGRLPVGYSVLRTKSAPGAAYVLVDDNDNRTDAREFLYLKTVGANVTVDLAVY